MIKSILSIIIALLAVSNLFAQDLFQTPSRIVGDVGGYFYPWYTRDVLKGDFDQDGDIDLICKKYVAHNCYG